MDAKMSRTRKKLTQRCVRFCENCLPGFKCVDCDKTFETKARNHTTAFHQVKTDFTTYVVKKSTHMIADLGCPNSVIGSKDVEEFIANLSEYQQSNLDVQAVDKNFKFGPSGPYRCYKKLRFPIETNTEDFIAEIAIVEADIPMLLGNNILKPLEAEIKLLSAGNGILKLQDLKIDMKETSGGHYTVKVADLRNLYNMVCLSANSYCEECDFVAKTGEDLRTHKDEHHGRNRYGYCDECKFVSKTTADLNKHKETKHDSKRSKYECTGCAFKAENEMESENQILDVH